MLRSLDTTAAIRWGINHGYPYHVVTVIERERCADALAWVFEGFGSKAVMSWTYAAPKPSAFLFSDPDVAFEFKMRWG